jgi:hypothetical protein
MKAAGWMAALSVGSWIVIALADRDAADVVLLGMAGPLAAAMVSWVLTARTYHRDPRRLTALLVLAFGAKMVFFGIYVTAAVALLAVRPVPFVSSLVGYFIALHLGEAILLRRLFAGGSHESR